MPRYSGVLIKKEYFEIEVDADDEDQAKDLIREASKCYSTYYFVISEEEKANA